MKLAVKSLVLTLGLLISVKSFANLELGKYAGVSAKDGTACEIEAKDFGFDNNQHHPLNEKVTFVENGYEWVAHHPRVVNVEEGTVRFNHNYFESIQPTPNGAKYLKVNINHDAEPHAPTSYTFIEDNYRDQTKSIKFECTDLKKVE